MNPANAKREEPKFTALIRWRGPDPAVELETQYPGFSSAREAALFAASSRTLSPARLRLSGDGIDLRLCDGRYVCFPYDTITAWILSPPQVVNQPRDVASPQFQMHSHSALAAYRSAHGDYARAWFAVLGADGIPVRVEINRNDITLRVPEIS